MRYGSVFFPIFLIVIGVFWLVRNVFPDLAWLRELHVFWPVWLILWGVVLLVRRTGWRNGWRNF